MHLTDLDQELIDAANQIIAERYTYGKHHVGAAIRTSSGRIITGVNVDTYVGRAGICAEAIALGRMISEGENEFDAIVAVYQPRPDAKDVEPYVASPCGICREMITDYNPEAMVIFMESGVVKKAKAVDLLPGKYVKK